MNEAPRVAIGIEMVKGIHVKSSILNLELCTDDCKKDNLMEINGRIY